MVIDIFAITILEAVLSTLIGAAFIALFKMFRSFVKEQKEANRLNSESIRSMQRDAILRMFQKVVEDGHPISIEEMDHLKKCYTSYHNNGGNGTGTLMYDKICAHAILVTKVPEGGDTDD